MAYVPGFKYDVFISYAHVDDAADPQGVQWVSDFQVFLKRAIKQHLAGYEPEIFFDALDLHPNHPIQAVLANARRAALLLPIISPGYVERPWPNDELQAFGEAVAEHDRIFAIELLPPIGDYPLLLRNLRRKEFWWRDEKQGSAPRKFTPKYRPETYTEYVDDIAYLIARRLREMLAPVQADRAAIVQTPEAGSSAIGGKKVLLAEPTDNLRRTCKQVREFLEQYDVIVLPKQGYPEVGPEFVKQFQADLQQADLLVQLLSEVRSIKSADLKFDDDPEPKSQGQYQYEAAKRAQVPVLQWHSPEIDLADVTHWDQNLLNGADVRAMGLQDFLKEIKTALERRETNLDDSKKKRNGEFIFINADRSDKEITEQMLKAFEDNPDLIAMEPLFEGPAEKIQEDLEENLRDCATLFLVYGNSPPSWVRAQLRRFHKLEKFRDEAPRLKAILLAPPAPKSERDIGSSGGFTKIDCQNGFTDEELVKILAELRK